ncbi:glycoside hydrolase N-terminal domain-containing protein [bacterium]|nr:glycoside hydrolase N-terminal domain-containing protein [bacterium]
MNKAGRVLAASLILLATAASAFAADNANTPLYRSSAETWTEALPIGNLRLRMAHQGEASNYRRQLELDEALVRITYRLRLSNQGTRISFVWCQGP